MQACANSKKDWSFRDGGLIQIPNSTANQGGADGRGHCEIGGEDGLRYWVPQLAMCGASGGGGYCEKKAGMPV